MDAPDCDPGHLAGALDALAAANRLFGAQRTLNAHVARILSAADPPARLRILDVGAGGGDLSAGLARFLGGRGADPHLVLADVHAGVLALCRDRVRSRERVRSGADASARARFVRLDGAALPFPDGAFDVALSCATLHHLDDASAARLLSELDRVSRLGWVAIDLRRSRATLLAVRLLASTLWRRRPFARADGPVSVRRSFTAPEVEALLERRGLRSAVVRDGVVRWVAWRSHAAPPGDGA